MRKRYKQLETEMEKARQYFSTKAADSEKNGLRTEILEYEQEYYQLEKNINLLEKIIRNTEIKLQKPWKLWMQKESFQNPNSSLTLMVRASTFIWSQSN